MGRKNKLLKINDRGNELEFRITEMSVRSLESWLIRAGLALAKTGVIGKMEINGTKDVVVALAKFLREDGLASLGKISAPEVMGLLDELLLCCEHKAGNSYETLTPDVVDGIISDVSTLFTLQKEAFLLHVNFSKLAESSKSDVPAATSTSPQRKPKISVRS